MKPQSEPTTLAEVGLTYYGNPRHEVLRYLPAEISRLLDVGCGNGAFGAEVRRKWGATVWGIELREDVALIAARQLSRVITGDALASLRETPAAYFDCITFNDVLEHLIDPAAVLDEAKRHLSPGGIVVASIPNVRYYDVLFDLVARGNWEYKEQGVLDRTHLRFFTEKSIRSLFTSLGYELVRMDGLNPPITPLGRFLTRLLPRRFKDVQFLQFLCIARPRGGGKGA